MTPLLKLYPKEFGEIVALEAGVLSLDIAPAIGRIVTCRIGEMENLFWLNAKLTPTPSGNIHYGGDRVHFSPISLWTELRGKLAPDPASVILPWQILHQSAYSITLQSAIDPDLGVQCTRTIILSLTGSELVQKYRIERIHACPHPVHAWTISQFPFRGKGWFHMKHPSSLGGESPVRLLLGNKEDFRLHSYCTERVSSFEWSKDSPSKLGFYGDWIAWQDGNKIVQQISPYHTDSFYFDRSNMQFYSDPHRGFVELETLSPSQSLLQGEHMEHEVCWRFYNTDGLHGDALATLLQTKSQ